MCNILKFTQNSLEVLIPYLLIFSQQCFVMTLLRHIAFVRNIFCFNGFNQTAIVLRYSVRIKPRKTIKTVKTENITHKHNMTLIVSSCFKSSFELGYSNFYSTNFFCDKIYRLICSLMKCRPNPDPNPMLNPESFHRVESRVTRNSTR